MPDRSTSAEVDQKDLARGAGVNYLGSIARIAPRALFLVLAGRFYGESGFGAYTFGTVVVETAAGFSLFGMKRSLYRFMGEAKARGESVHGPIAHGVALAVAVGSALTLLVAATAGLLALRFGLPSATRPLLVLTLAIPLIVISDMLLIAIRFTRQMRFDVFSRSLVEPITLTVVLVALHTMGVGEIGLSYAYVAALFAAAATSVLFFTRVFSLGACLRVPLRATEIRSLASFSGPTAGYELLMMLADKADVFIVSYFGSAGTLGIYGMARQFATITKKIRAGFDRILPAVYSESLASGDLERAGHQLGMVARWVMTAQLLIVLVFMFFGTAILGTVNDDFAAGALVLVLLMIGDAINGSLGVSELPFVYLRPSANIFFGGAMLALNTGLGLVLVQAYGAVGAATSVLVTVIVVNAVRIVASRWMFGQSVVGPTLAKPVVSAMIASAAAWGAGWMLYDVGAFGHVLQLVVLIGVYLAVLVILRVEPEDRAQVQRVLSRLRGR